MRRAGPWPRYLAISADGARLAVGISGDRRLSIVDTHELLVYRAADLPFQDFGGTDHIPPELLQGPYFTDGEIHDAGLGSPRDRHQGYNTPSLVHVGQKVLLLHDGRAKSLQDLLTGPHSPSKVSGTDDFGAQELQDLIAFLRSL